MIVSTPNLGSQALFNVEQEQRLPGAWRNFKMVFRKAIGHEVQRAKCIQPKGTMVLSSGKKSIAVLVASTNKHVLENVEQMTERARKKGMAPISVLDETTWQPILTTESELEARAYLSRSPAEVHLLIFENLNAYDSTCLGLTCKKFYEIHRSIYGTVPLWTGCCLTPYYMSPPESGLWYTLRNWFPAHLHYNFQTGKYVNKKKFKKFLKERREHREWRQARRTKAKYHGRYRLWLASQGVLTTESQGWDVAEGGKYEITCRFFQK
jgi:hypothetical protein